MHIQDREIRRIVDDEKEYRYGRFIDIRSQLERMTISLDENNGCYRAVSYTHLDVYKRQE